MSSDDLILEFEDENESIQRPVAVPKPIVAPPAKPTAPKKSDMTQTGLKVALARVMKAETQNLPPESVGQFHKVELDAAVKVALADYKIKDDLCWPLYFQS